MRRYELTPGVLNIAETCAASVSVEDLQALSTDKQTPGPLSLSRKLTYGAIRGSDTLRARVAALYDEDGGGGGNAEPVRAEDILITQGAIVANFLLFYTLLGPQDHVICVYPTYQQLYGVPESLGAEVSLWRLRAENGYVPDVGELPSLARPNTKMIVLNNPNNPTGATIPAPVLGAIVDFARARNIIVLCDEVYRPLFHSPGSGVGAEGGEAPSPSLAPAPAPPSILSFGYARTISTSSMSKAWSLAGLRVGWIATCDAALLARVAEARDYTTISVSQVDDQIASYALSPAVRPALLARNLALARANLDLLGAFVRGRGRGEGSGTCSWVRPTAGTTAFVRFTDASGQPVEDVAFCLDVLEKTKVMFLPGSKCFGHGKDFKGYVRIGYVSETAVLKEALEKLGAYLDKNLPV